MNNIYLFLNRYSKCYRNPKQIQTITEKKHPISMVHNVQYVNLLRRAKLLFVVSRKMAVEHSSLLLKENKLIGIIIQKYQFTEHITY